MFQADVSPLQLHKLRALPSGMTESDHLSQAYLTEPERMDAVLAYAFGTQNETVLSMLTGGYFRSTSGAYQRIQEPPYERQNL